jgi:muconolactone delta-isomerase
MEALKAWADKNLASGKFEMVWSDAGTSGGGGIANVDSLDELDAIMAGFPLGPFSEVKIVPIVDLNDSIKRTQQAFQAMAGG